MKITDVIKSFILYEKKRTQVVTRGRFYEFC